MALFSAIGAVATAVTGWLGSTALGTIALNMAVGVGLSLAQQAFFAPEEVRMEPAGIVGSTGRGGTEQRSIMFGDYATAGSLMYENTSGKATPNILLHQAICLSDIPVSKLTGIFVDGERCTIDWDNGFAGRGFPILEYRKDGKDHLWVKFYDGRQTEADPELVRRFGDDPEYPWDETAVAYGCSYAVMTAKLERSLFSGFPSYIFELSGACWYDIRKDSTAGGNGPHRWGDYATWEPSTNNAVIAYNILRGVRFEGQWLYGLQKTAAAQFPYANWAAGMDACDVQAATLDGSGTEPRYRASGEIRLGEEIIDPVKKLMTACEGRIAEIGGIYKIHIGEPSEPVLHITDDDILSTQPQDLDPFRGLAEQVNGIAPRYPNPIEAYQEHPGPTRWNDQRVAAVGGRQLPTDISYNYVPFKGQVQRLTAQQLAEYNRQRRHTIVLGPEAQILEQGIDTIAWTSKRNGYQGKLFRVEGMEDLPYGDMRVQLVEVDHADYDFDPATQYRPDPDAPIVITRPAVQDILAWGAEPATFVDANANARRPSITVKFEGDAGDVKEVRVQVRLAATGQVVFDQLIPYGEEEDEGSIKSVTLNGTFLPATLYETRAEFIPYSGRETRFTGWIPVTTPNVLFGTPDILDNAIVASKIADAAVTADKLMDEAVTSIKLAAEAVTESKLAVGAASERVIAAGAVVSEKLAEGAVGLTKFASGLTPVEIVDSLPTTGNFEGRQAAYNGKLYRYAGGGWTAAVDATDIVGDIPVSIPDGSVTAAKIADAAVTAIKLQQGAVTHDKLSAGSVYGDVIAARSITARELVLTDFSNIVPDNQLMQTWVGSGPDWANYPNGSPSWDTPRIWRQAISGITGAYLPALQTGPFPVEPSKEYWFSYQQHKAVSSDAAELWARVHWFDSTGAALPGLDQYTTLHSGPVGFVQKITKNILVPPAAASANIRWYVDGRVTTTNVSIGGVVCRRAYDASLIVDGSITAEKISAAEAITVGGIRLDTILGYSYADGFRFGFEPDELAKIPVYQDNVIEPETDDIFAGLQSLRIYCSADPALLLADSGFDTDADRRAVIAPVPMEPMSSFYGKRVKITIFAKQTATNGSSGFALSFASGSSAGNSGWQYFTPTADWAPYTFYYDVQVPARVTTGGGLVIWADTSGTGKGIIVDGVSVASNTEDFARDPATQINLNVTTIDGGKITTGTVRAAQIDSGAVTTAKLDANAVTSAKIMAGAVKASQLDAGAVTTAKLAVGSANNVLYNASFTMGLDGWKFYNSGIPPADLDFSIRSPLSSYSGVNYPTLMVRQVGTSGSYFDLHNYAPGLNSFVEQTLLPVKPGDMVESSVYVSAHRCTVELRIRWVAADGTTVAYSGTPTNDSNSGSSNNPDAWPRLVTRGIAPAGAVGAAFHLRKRATNAGQNDSYMFVHKPLVGRTVSNASEPLEWSPGIVTIIDSDGIATGAVTAAKILAGTITTTEMASGSITTVKLAAGAVTGEKIQGGTITGEKIQGATITGEKLVAKSLTVREIVITDFENLVPNGLFQDGDQALLNAVWGSGSGNGQPQLLVNSGYSSTGGNVLNIRKNEPGASVNITMQPEYNVPVTPGEVLYGETSVQRNESSSAQGGFYFRLMWLSRDGSAAPTAYTDIANNQYPGTNPTVYSGQVTVPAGAYFMRVRLYNHNTSTMLNMLVDRVIVRRAKAANLIVDGAITADKLGVNKLSAIAGDVGELVAGLVRSANNKIRLDLDGELFTMDD